MRLLRLIGAGLIALTAVAAVLFTAAVVFVAGLAGYLVQLFRRSPGSAPARPSYPPNRRPAMRTDDAIDVVTTKVEDGPAKR